jgi:hypothetical protein
MLESVLIILDSTPQLQNIQSQEVYSVYADATMFPSVKLLLTSKASYLLVINACRTMQIITMPVLLIRRESS